MIKILDYGSGNVRAIANIFSFLNVLVGQASCSADLEDATKIILPGVGAFDETMRLLKESAMLGCVNDLVLGKKLPVLGVCVGMQIMANGSEEGASRGLGWIDGEVRKIPKEKLNHKPCLPHMGWNVVNPTKNAAIFDGIDIDKGFYFLHSYRFECCDESDVIATSTYGEEFVSAVARDNVYGFQFHPEKSHSNGIQIFKNFASI